MQSGAAGLEIHFFFRWNSYLNKQLHPNTPWHAHTAHRPAHTDTTLVTHSNKKLLHFDTNVQNVTHCSTSDARQVLFNYMNRITLNVNMLRLLAEPNAITSVLSPLQGKHWEVRDKYWGEFKSYSEPSYIYWDNYMREKSGDTKDKVTVPPRPIQSLGYCSCSLQYGVNALPIRRFENTW